MPRHRYVVYEAAFTTLLVLSNGKLPRFCPRLRPWRRSLLRLPISTASMRTAAECPRVAGNFLIAYWPDPNTSTVYILRIDRLED